MGTSVYVHFPWCLKKCPYCDFASAGIRPDDVPHVAYADAVLAELDWRAPGLAGAGAGALTSVFFGGGTPSLWESGSLERVLTAILGAFSEVSPDLEITVECNPTSLDQDKARALREAGVNRLSIGVQSLDAESLRYLGRLHDAEGALRAVSAACREMPRVSADLMFGMPGQKPDAFEREIDAVLETGVEHVSAYALTIEPGTQFGALKKRGLLPIAPDDDYADTFLRAEEVFRDRGLSHYEVSNYARPGAEARHNLHYWRGGDYLGLGAGAVGALGDRSDGGGSSEGRTARRYKNDPRPEGYMARVGSPAVEVFEEHLSPEDRVREALMLGLRTFEGVDLDALSTRTGVDALTGRAPALARRRAQGDVVLEDGRLRVPRSRWLVLDGIVADLF